MERFPVFLVNCFSPLGHSGQPKLSAVGLALAGAAGAAQGGAQRRVEARGGAERC